MKLSVLIVAHNEDARLAWCIAEARQYADEVVVVSQGSTDRTLELACELADTALEHPAMGMGEFSRKDGFAACTGDWVLVLDADERLSPWGLRIIRELMECPYPAVFNLRRLTTVDGAVLEDLSHLRMIRPRDWDHIAHRSHSGLFPVPGTAVVQVDAQVVIEHFKANAEQLVDDANYRARNQMCTALHPEYEQVAWCRVLKAQGAMTK